MRFEEGGHLIAQCLYIFLSPKDQGYEDHPVFLMECHPQPCHLLR